MNLNDFKINETPATVFYIPNFITEDEELNILKNVYSVPKPKWTCLSNRRLQDYGGVPHKKGMIPEKIPNWLSPYLNKIDELNVFEGKAPNQVLVNEYLPGQGIMAHTDGPLFYPVVTTISCGSHTILQFLENTVERKKVCNLLLERRSLVIFQDDLYKNYLHSIEDVTQDVIEENCCNLKNCNKTINIKDVLKRDTRVSITIRNVPKVLKIKLWN